MSPQQRTAVSLTKRLLLFLICGAASIFLIKGIYAIGMVEPQESSGVERKLKITEFKDMPLVVQKVRNLQSDTWNKDLEIEVKNVSSKPIYFILAYLIFPDDKSAAGEVGFPLTFGERENILISQLALPGDVHLEPDETYIFTIPDLHRRGFEGRHKKYPDAYKNFRLDIALVSFGDGTGWELGEPRDKRKKASALGIPDEKDEKKSLVNAPPLNPAATNSSIVEATLKYRAHAPSIQSECGGGNGCSPWVIQGPFPSSCYCQETFMGVTQSGQPCSRLKFLWFACEPGGELVCYNEAI